MNSDIKKKQDRLLSLILKFDKACSESGARYSLACGTALGAVREKGFIAWDDDFDIMMPLPDYKLMDKTYEKYSEDFAWVCARSNPNSPVVLARIYEKDVDFDHLEDFPYIDIHIFAGCSQNDRQVSLTISKADLVSKIYWIKHRKYHNIFKRKKSLIGSLCKIPLIIVPSALCKNTIIKSAEKWEYGASKRVMPIQGYYKMKEVFDRQMLENYIKISFCGHELPLIENYDAYLRQLYGDYMTPIKFH